MYGIQVCWLTRSGVLVLAVVLSWLVIGSECSVAGCTWHIYIVNTADAAKYDAPAVHNAMPRAPYVDVTDSIRNLTITGIRIQEHVRPTSLITNRI